MRAETAELLGLSCPEQVAYELLVDRPPSTVADLAAVWLRTEPVRAVLDGMVARGLLSRLPATPLRYAVANPALALGPILADAERRLDEVAAYASQLAAQERGPAGVFELVIGATAVGQWLSRAYHTATEQVRAMADPRFPESGADSADLLARGVAHRVLYDHAALERPDGLPAAEELADAGQQARVLASIPLELHLVDDTLALLPLHRDSTAIVLVIHESAVLDALHVLFEGLWQRATPLRLPGGGPVTGNSGVDDQRLIGLLLSGLSDESIARQLGVSHRTAQRRTAALMADLGAHTRFQAGMQAANRARLASRKAASARPPTAAAEETPAPT